MKEIQGYKFKRNDLERNEKMSQSLISEPITPRRNVCPPRLAISPPRMSITLQIRDHSSIYNHRQLSRRLDYSNDSSNDSTPIHHIELKHCSDDS